MRKKPRNGSNGRSRARILDEQILRRRILSCKSRNPRLSLSLSSLDEVVDELRTNFPDYSRIKHQPFSVPVSNALKRISERDAELVGSSSSNSGKKLKRGEESEERLLGIDRMHIEKRKGDDESSDEEESSLAEPAFDLLKDLYRESISKNVANVKPKSNGVVKSKSKGDEDEKVMEVEINSGRDKELFGEVGKSEDVKVGKLGGLEVKGKDRGGPRFSDLGGMESVLKELKSEIFLPLFNPKIHLQLGIKPVAGVLLHGPPGCGKTTLAHAIANETGVPFYKISATEVVSGVSGASEEYIRELFSKAYRTAPSIIFIDEIDAIASKMDNLQRGMEKRIVSQLKTCMGESEHLVQPNDADIDSGASKPGYVLVIGATNRPDAIDPALRRPGRFELEIGLGVPDESARLQIFSVLTKNFRLEGSFDLMKIARSTPGFVGADLSALVNKAGRLAMKRILDEKMSKLSRDLMDETTSEEWWKHLWLPEEIDNLSIIMADFENAIKLVQPSLKREGFSDIPNVKWEDVGGLDHLRQEFYHNIVKRIKCPELDMELGDLNTGFLLYGPPGCGKTLIAKAVANEAGANFIYIKGPELLSKYVGESELAVRTLFSRAKTCAPCILFFDEVDALTTERGKEGDSVVGRVVSQLLLELNGSEHRRGVFVIGATNRPEVMDLAVRRPGRFGKLLYVPLPTADERGLILKALARNKRIDVDVDLNAIGRMCENFCGADLCELMNEAVSCAVEEKQKLTESSPDATLYTTIKTIHFDQARRKVSPSVSEEQKHYYELLSQSLKAAQRSAYQ